MAYSNYSSSFRVAGGSVGVPYYSHLYSLVVLSSKINTDLLGYSDLNLLLDL